MFRRLDHSNHQHHLRPTAQQKQSNTMTLNPADFTHLMEYKARRASTFLALQGFSTSQHNGQRISINLRYRQFETEIENLEQNEVFIGHIPRDSFEDELFEQMNKAGPIYKIRWMMDFSQSNRGYAFVKYVSRDAAQRSIALLNHYPLRGHGSAGAIGAKISKDNKVLYFGNLPERSTAEQLVLALERFEVHGIVGAIMDDELGAKRRQNNNNNHGLISSTSVLDANNNPIECSSSNSSIGSSTNCKRFGANCRSKNHHHHQNNRANDQRCFVLFESHSAATTARRIIMPCELRIQNKKIRMDWAKTDIKESELSFFNLKNVNKNNHHQNYATNHHHQQILTTTTPEEQHQPVQQQAAAAAADSFLVSEELFRKTLFNAFQSFTAFRNGPGFVSPRMLSQVDL